MISKKNNDIHSSLVEEFCLKVKKKIPNCSIGVTGSVSKFEHNENSDIDLLLIDKNFNRNRQYYYYGLPIEINILCLNPDMVKEYLNMWTIMFNGQHLNYIIDTKVLYDSTGILRKMIMLAKKQYNLVGAGDINLKKLCKNKIEQILLNNDLIKTDRLNLLSYSISLWFLYREMKLKNKMEHNSSFKKIKKADHNFYKEIKNIIYYKHTDTEVKLLINSKLDEWEWRPPMFN